ncbi:MAG: efflux RND transporter periplasmic adaptor subunit [Verrucomicrobiota bacterium]|jgi:HlyD family secretion protein
MRAHSARSSRHPWAFSIALPCTLGLGLLLTGAGCQRAKEVQVQAEKVQRRNLTETVMATGKVQPVTLVKITPEVAGEIIDLPVKEGQKVRKGDLLVRIRRDLYEAGLRSSQASLRSAEAALVTAQANERKAAAEFQRNQELFDKKLVSESVHDDMRTALEVSSANVASATQQIEIAKASIKRADEDLLKTTILAPIDGTVTRLASEVGERVHGTGMMAGTEILSLADLGEMEARVEVGEVDVVLIHPGQKARLEVDSFRDRRFTGLVTQVARSAKTQGVGTQQESTKFEVRIRIQDKETFLPGMSVTAEIETRYRTNVWSVPIQSITTRVPGASNVVASAGGAQAATPDAPKEDFQVMTQQRKAKDAGKAREVVFIIEDGKARMIPIQRGISDDTHYEVVEGVQEGMEVITGSFRALSRELEEGKAVTTQTNKPGWSLSFKASAAP